MTAHYLTLAGLPPPNAAHPPSTPLPLARLIGLATQKFIADIAADAYQFARIRSSNPANVTAPALLPGQIAGQLGGNEGVAGSKSAPKGGLGQQRAGFGAGGSAAGAQSGRTVLTMEDLGMAVGEWGINLKRSEFYR